MQMQVDAVRHRNAVARAQEARVREHERGRQQPVAQQPLRAVEIAQDQIEQPALAASAPSRGELHSAGGMSSGTMSSSHGRSTPCGIAVDVVGDAVLANARLALSHRDANSCRPSVSSDRTNASQCGRSRRPASINISSDSAIAAAGTHRAGARVSSVPGCVVIDSINEDLWRSGPSRCVGLGAVKSSVNGKSGIAFLGGTVSGGRRVPDVEEPREAPAFRLVGVDRKRLEAAAAGMRDVVDAAADRALVPRVHEIEHERRVHRNRRMQRAGGCQAR